MASLAKVVLIGYLGGDPELKQQGQGDPVCNFSVATSFRPRDGDEETAWWRIAAWGKQGEACAQYLRKGSQVYVEGRLKVREYESKGATRFSLDVTASMVQFLSGKGDSAAAGASSESKSRGSSSSRGADEPPPPEEEELPF